jgi:hypothetical protein
MNKSQLQGEDKTSKIEFLHQRVNDVQERLSEVNDQTNKKFSVVKENIAKIQKQIEDEKQKTDSLLESKNHYIKVLENKIFERFDQEAQIRKEIEKKLFALIEDRFNGLKIEISKESRNRYESIENLKNYLENDIPKLQGLLKFEQSEREENDTNILKKTNDEVQAVQNLIQTEKKSREETEEAILEMLRIMITRMKSDIESERKERETTEETLLSLLEDTCNKLNASSQV